MINSMNDWEFEDYIREKYPDLARKFVYGELTLEQIRKRLGVKQRK